MPAWFAAGEERPLLAFAGLWTRWTSVRKAREGEVSIDVYGFLTTEPNSIVAPIQPKAMPVDPDHRAGAGYLDAGTLGRG